MNSVIMKKSQQFDLNLLLTLKVLLETQSVSKTCKITNTSQPTISRNLARLRDFFNDELLIRDNNKLQATQKALEIQRDILPILGLLNTSLTQETNFDPKNIDGEITIALNGFLASSYTIDICSTILKQAPDAQLNIISWDENSTEQLLKGSIDAGVNYFPFKAPKTLTQKIIAKDEFVLICHNTNPLLQTTLNKVSEVKLASLLVHGWNDQRAYAQDTLHSIGIQSKVRFRSNYLDSILDSVKNENLVFPCSRLLYKKLKGPYSILPIPKEAQPPQGNIGFICARTLAKSPFQLWLKSVVALALTGKSH